MNRCRLTGWLACLMTLPGCTLMMPAEEDPVYIRTTDLDNRLTQVERVLDNDGLMSLLAKLDALEKDVQLLRNDVETLQHSSGQSGDRQRELYLDLDQRMQSLEQGAARLAVPAAAVAGGVALSAGQLPVPGGTDQENYQAAFDLLKQGQYDQASIAFQQFMVAFPDSGLADNAQYWLAETHYVSQKYPQALPEFQALLKRYPDSRKIPDTLLKVGYCHYELEDWDAARAALSTVAADYPETTAARLANQRLDRMKGEGH